MPESVKRDPKVPRFLQITVQDGEGSDQRAAEWSTMTVQSKDFSSGSVGFYGSDKITNPESGERYQCGLIFTLMGSKPGK
ncbi:hypothetical protein FACS1894110_19010 [Spirochaetia bacterium]|nr:hypothetical protein FACS1894110_19010 [Spirochaetia bacterium]